MASNFPTSLDNFTNPTSTDTLDSPPHDVQHSDANDAIESLQAKVGAASSAVTTSHDYKISTLETDVSTAQTDITNINELQQNTQTASYTLVLSDAGKLVEMNVSSANNLTVPPNSSVAFPVGTQILVVQLGTGTTTIVAGSGVSLRSKDSNLVINGRYVAVTLVKRNTDDWWVLGDLTS